MAETMTRSSRRLAAIPACRARRALLAGADALDRLAQTCGNCQHADTDTPDDANKDHECRRYPPTAAGFPGVGLGTWCGEHKSKGDA